MTFFPAKIFGAKHCEAYLCPLPQCGSTSPSTPQCGLGTI